MKNVACTLLVFVSSSLFAQQTAPKSNQTTNSKADVIIDVSSDTKIDIVKPVEGKTTRVKEPSVSLFTSGKYYRIEIDSWFRFKPCIFYNFNLKQAG